MKQLNVLAMKRKLLTSLFLLLTFVAAMAQTPEMYPPPVPEPVDLTLFNIILYFVIPVALIVFYILYRRSKRKKQKENERETK